MTRMPKRSYYTILVLAAVGAILLVLPVKAFEVETNALAQAPDQGSVAEVQSSTPYFETVEITPNEEMAGVAIERFEDRIWDNDIVLRPDDI